MMSREIWEMSTDKRMEAEEVITREWDKMRVKVEEMKGKEGEARVREDQLMNMTIETRIDRDKEGE